MVNPVRVWTGSAWQDLALVGPPGAAGAAGAQGPAGVDGNAWGTVATFATLPATGSTPQGAQYRVTAGIGLYVAVNTPSGWQVDPVSDSGWQSITTLGINGWSLTGSPVNRLRRQGNRVRMKLDALAPTTFAAILIANAPAGFNYSANESSFVTQPITSESALARSTSTGTVSTNPNYVRILGATVASGLRCVMTAEYTTDDAWPTTTPQ